jgi:hypothetical protein
MKTTNMKSGINKTRLSFFLLLFSVFSVRAIAHTPYDGFNFNDEPVFIQGLTVGNNQPGSEVFNKPDTKLAPSAITLIVTHYQLRIAQIGWSSSTPGIPGTFFVERQVLPSAVWEVLKQLPYNATLAYNDTISAPYCSATNFSYRIRFVSDSGSDDATSGSATVSLSDLTSPANVHDLNVSLGDSNSGYNPQISWTKVTNDSISGYIIQRSNGFNWPVIGNVPADSNTYNDQSASDVCNNSFKYVIVTIDRCGNRSAPDYKQFVQTVKLVAQQPGQCDKSAKLSWNSYKNIPGGLGGYKIYRTNGAGSPIEFDTKDTFYVDNSNLINGHTYIYSVKAYSSNRPYSSSSCQAVLLFNPSVIPEVYITQANVEADSYVRVSYHVSPPSSVIKLVLERSDNGSTNFKAIDSAVVSGIYVQPDFYIDDTTADVHTQSYYYRLVAYDDCGGITASLNISQSIWLQCSSSETQNIVSWNSYESWLQGVAEYKVYRTVGGQPILGELFGPFTPTTVSFPDPLTNVDPTKEVCYWVVASENPQNPYMLNAISKSNTCCIIKEPVLYMPNAFYPDGFNKKLRPVPSPSFVDPLSFTMTIFSRWGQQLFETTDMVNGWDGLINGQFAPAGLYAYILTYKSLEGKEYTKRGTATLVR